MPQSGYLLPDSVPSDVTCVQVYVPNCPEAIRALRGSFHFLCAWVAWERTADHRALEMAQAFKRADTLSWLECANMIGCTCDEIRAIVREEINNMSIVVNNNCGCCGCSGSGGGATSNIPPMPDDIDELPPSAPQEPLPTDDPYLDYKCRYAQFLIDSLIGVSIGFRNLWLAGTVTTDALVAIIGGIPVLRPIWVIVVQVAAYLSGIANSGLFDNLISVFQEHRDELVCVVYTADSPADAESGLETAVMSYTEYAYVSRLIAWLIIQLVPFGASMELDAVDIPDAYSGDDCCVEEVPDPTSSSIYFEIAPGGGLDASAYYGLPVPVVDGLNVVYYQEYALQSDVSAMDGFRLEFSFTDNLGAPVAARIRVLESFGWTGEAGGDYAFASFDSLGNPTLISDLVPPLPANGGPDYKYWVTKRPSDSPPGVRIKFIVLPA